MGHSVRIKVQMIFLAMLASIAFIAPPVNCAYSQQQTEQSLEPGWIYVNETHDWVFWVHSPSRVKRGDIAGIWVVRNSRTIENTSFGSFQSVRVFYEYNCTSRQSRASELSWHSRLNARGDNIGSRRGDSEWGNVPPQTILEDVMLVACRR